MGLHQAWYGPYITKILWDNYCISANNAVSDMCPWWNGPATSELVGAGAPSVSLHYRLCRMTLSLCGIVYQAILKGTTHSGGRRLRSRLETGHQLPNHHEFRPSLQRWRHGLPRSDKARSLAARRGTLYTPHELPPAALAGPPNSHSSDKFMANPLLAWLGK